MICMIECNFFVKMTDLQDLTNNDTNHTLKRDTSYSLTSPPLNLGKEVLILLH